MTLRLGSSASKWALLALLLVLGVGGILWLASRKHAVRYEPRAALHVPSTSKELLRLDPARGLPADFYRQRLLPLLGQWLGVGDEGWKVFEREGLYLSRDVREVLLAGGEESRWAVVLGGVFAQASPSAAWLRALGGEARGWSLQEGLLVSRGGLVLGFPEPHVVVIASGRRWAEACVAGGGGSALSLGAPISLDVDLGRVLRHTSEPVVASLFAAGVRLVGNLQVGKEAQLSGHLSRNGAPLNLSEQESMGRLLGRLAGPGASAPTFSVEGGTTAVGVSLGNVRLEEWFGSLAAKMETWRPVAETAAEPAP